MEGALDTTSVFNSQKRYARCIFPASTTVHTISISKPSLINETSYDMDFKRCNIGLSYWLYKYFHKIYGKQILLLQVVNYNNNNNYKALRMKYKELVLNFNFNFPLTAHFIKMF
jgi:hypothetical protein